MKLQTKHLLALMQSLWAIGLVKKYCVKFSSFKIGQISQNRSGLIGNTALGYFM